VTSHRRAPLFVGRQAELEQVDAVLARVASSSGPEVVLVDGADGMGKSRLVSEAVDRAERRGYDCAVLAVDPLDHPPLGPLLSALHGSTAAVPSAPSSPGHWSRRASDGPALSLDAVRARIAERASHQPLVIALDDLQWADPATLTALRLLPSELARAPLLWLLASSAPVAAPATERLWSDLEDDGARRLELHPLAADEVQRLLADLLGAAPDEGLSGLVAGASGNPRLVVELTHGMLDEGAVESHGDAAQLVTPRLPQRLERVLRRRFSGLSDPVRQLLQVAAVLGGPVTVDEVAEMLSQPPVAVLPAIQAAVASGVLLPRGDFLEWCYELEREWVLGALPGSVRQALQRQRELVRQAPLEGPPTWPRVAEARASFEPEGSTRLTFAAKAMEAVEVLSSTGQSREASQLASAVLASSVPGGGTELAPALARERRGNDVVVRSLVELARGAWSEGRIEEALALTRQGLTMATVGLVGLGNDHPGIWLSSMLIDLRRLADAHTAILLLKKALSGHTTASSPAPDVVSARLHYVGGRLALAAARAETGLARAELTGATELVPIALAVLGGAALRRGDFEAAVRWTARMPAELLHDGSGPSYVQALWAAGQVSQAHPGAEDHEQLLYKALEDPVALRCLLLSEPASGAWVVRRRVDRAAAEAVTAEAEALAAANRGFATVQAAADHARGVLERDAEALVHACHQHEDPWARASAAEDLGVLLVAQGHQEQAVTEHQRAVEQYDAAGSSRDSARVRSRLRQLGVRTRYWAQDSNRPVAGWASLTETERRVADLVASGLTNRQTAGKLFVSSHTVSFHLRQVFRKLGVTSRVDLARRAAEARVADDPND
jgi:DNA-binding CsgD family transcriptional regulator